MQCSAAHGSAAQRGGSDQLEASGASERGIIKSKEQLQEPSRNAAHTYRAPLVIPSLSPLSLLLLLFFFFAT